MIGALAGRRPRLRRALPASMFGRELPAFPRVRAVVWFNGTGGTGADFWYNSSAAATSAFRRALRSSRYAATGASLLGSAK